MSTGPGPVGAVQVWVGSTAESTSWFACLYLHPVSEKANTEGVFSLEPRLACVTSTAQDATSYLYLDIHIVNLCIGYLRA